MSTVTTAQSQQAILTLTTRVSQDPRLGHVGGPGTRIEDFLGQWALVYFEQRAAGVDHDAAIAYMLEGLDGTLGGRMPAPIAVLAPDVAQQPTEDLVTRDAQLYERRRRIAGGQEEVYETLWPWRGVLVESLDVPETLLAWASSVGANIVEAPVPEDPGTVQERLEVLSQYRLRVAYRGKKDPVKKPKEVPLGTANGIGPEAIASSGKAIAVTDPDPDPVEKADPLNAPNVVNRVRTMPVIAPGNLSPSDLFAAGVLMTMRTGGGSLDITEVPLISEAISVPTETVQVQAEFFFKGLATIDPEVQQWTEVLGGDLGFPLQWSPSLSAEAFARVSGPQAIVLLIRRAPKGVLEARKGSGWTITAVSGPEHSLVYLRR